MEGGMSVSWVGAEVGRVLSKVFVDAMIAYYSCDLGNDWAADSKTALLHSAWFTRQNVPSKMV